MKNKEKRLLQEGITLVALIITIIILIILAAVTIMTIYDGNFIGMAINGTENYAQEQYREMDMINSLNSKLNDAVEKITEAGNGEQGEKPNVEVIVANKPDISGFDKEKTYYVSWDLDSNPYKINEGNKLNQKEPDNWYDYKEGVNKWANVKTTGGGNDCYWVWIPRYAYRITTKGNTAETIEVKFLQGTTNIPIGEEEEITNTTPMPGEWVIHPAFTNEGNGGFGELSGIWVAKFEASSNSANVVENPTNSQIAIDGGSNLDTDLQVRVKPNVVSWRNITIRKCIYSV